MKNSTSSKVQLTRKYYHSHARLDREILTRLIGKLSNQKHCHFVQRLIKEIKEPFEELQFWIQFKILDPRNLPKSKDQINFIWQRKINATLNTLWFLNKGCFSRKWEIRKYVGPDIDMDQTKAEWSGFKNLIFQKWQAHYQAIDPKISAIKMSKTEGKK